MLHHSLKHSKTRKTGPNSDTITRVTTEPTPISLTLYSASTPTLGLSNERQPELELEVEEVRVRVRVKLQLQHAQQGTAMAVLAAFETRRRGRFDAVSMAFVNTTRATAVGDRQMCCRGGSGKKPREGRGADCVRWRVSFEWLLTRDAKLCSVTGGVSSSQSRPSCGAQFPISGPCSLRGPCLAGVKDPGQASEITTAVGLSRPQLGTDGYIVYILIIGLLGGNQVNI